jgi:hypothetical protein
MSIVPSSLKVVELRKELSSRGLPTKGRKKDLVKRLEKALANTQPASVNETPLNDQGKPSEMASEEKPVEQDKVSDKPAEETIQQNIEQAASTETLPEQSIDITNEQKVEPTLNLLGDKAADASITDNQQTVEPIIETPQPQEPSEKPIDIIFNNDTVQVEAIEQPNNESIQQQSGDILSEPVIEKPSDESIEKPQEQLIEKPAEELIPKSLEDLIGRPIDQLISNSMDQFMPSSVGGIHPEDDDLMGHREAASMAREQMVTPPKDDLEFKMPSINNSFKEQDTILFDEDRGTKRKMDEDLHEEPGKIFKIDGREIVLNVLF